MAFVDRVVEYPGRVKLTAVSGQTDTYDVTRTEGTVTTEGTLLNATNLNAQTVNRYTPSLNVDTTAATGTTDGDLYAALTAIGWDDDTGDNPLDLKILLTKIMEILTSSIKVIQVTLDTSPSIAADGTSAIVTTDISASIPNGYTTLFVTERGTSHTNFYFWYLAMSQGATTVQYRVHNVGSSAAAVTPTAYVVCIKS